MYIQLKCRFSNCYPAWLRSGKAGYCFQSYPSSSCVCPSNSEKNCWPEIDETW